MKEGCAAERGTALVVWLQWFVKNLSGGNFGQAIDFQVFEKWHDVVKIGFGIFLHVWETPERWNK